MTLRGYEVVLQAFRQRFGQDLDISKIPIISTEGGVFTPEHANWGGLSYPRVPKDDNEHAQQTVDLFRFVERRTPLTAMCPWCLAEGQHIIGHGSHDFRHHGWFKEVNGQLQKRPVYERMRELKGSTAKESDLSALAALALSTTTAELGKVKEERAKTVVTINVQIEVEVDGEADDIVVNINPQVK
jgi:hypothetical protein